MISFPTGTGKNPLTPPIRSAWMMVEETLARIRSIILPRIEWFRIWFRLKRAMRQKEELFVRLGQTVVEPESEAFWPNTSVPNPQLTAMVGMIRELEVLETNLREWLEYLEDRDLLGALAHLQEDLDRRIVKTRILLVSEDSPYLGLSINDLRKKAATDGLLPLTAFRGNFSAEVGPRLPLGIGDRLIVLTVWKPLREGPPASTIFEIDGSPDHLGDPFD